MTGVSIRLCRLPPFCAGLGLLLLAACAQAQGQQGKLLLSGGVSSVEGAAGGGLVPWALVGSYASPGQVGATAFATAVKTQHYQLSAQGVAVGLGDRVELSLARQELDTGDTLAPLGLAGLRLRQTVVGAKLRLVGDAVLDSDTPMPQLALGVQHKSANAGALAPTLAGPLGAHDAGTDVYLSATKLLLARGLLLNGTLRGTRANQFGLLGFGSVNGNRLRWQPEVAVAWLLRRQLAVGLEYRAKPDQLDRSALGDGALAEDDAFDVFVAWAPSKTVSLTAAWVDLGRIVPAVQPERQRGAYVSVQLAF